MCLILSGGDLIKTAKKSHEEHMPEAKKSSASCGS